MTQPVVIDAFAGAGGWEALSGVDALGIELDESACSIREAAGLWTLRADVSSAYVENGGLSIDGPWQRHHHHWKRGEVEGLIASPPCPTFSSAGRGSGRDLESIIRAAIKDLADGHDTRAERRREAYELLEPETARFDTLARPRKARKREQHAVSPANRQRIAKREAKRATARQEATTSLLVVEPLRWALALSPRWIALEQVPPVLPLWEAMADVLRERGYSVWCGILSAERYGCPQTRQRAILIASLDRVVSMPPPTHQRYIAPRKRAQQATADALFAVPEPERIVAPEDRHLLPWMSMAEALQWGMTARPSVSVLAKTGGRGGHRPLEGGSGARETLHRAREDGEWPLDSPAPTIRYGSRLDDVSWVSRSGQSVAGDGRAERALEDPCLTVISRFDLCEWVTERPSTTVNCDPRIAEPGRHEPGESGSQYGPETVRVSIAEAAALQSFPADWPWHAAGTKTAAFRAVGNAVPPLLALHVLLAVVGPELAASLQERLAALTNRKDAA